MAKKTNLEKLAKMVESLTNAVQPLLAAKAPRVVSPLERLREASLRYAEASDSDDAEFKRADAALVESAIAFAAGVKRAAPRAAAVSRTRRTGTTAVLSADELRWTTEKKTCPVCHKTKPVLSDKTPREPDFGIRTARGITGPQSYCRACRSNLDYHNAKRQYQSKNNPG